MLKRVFIISLLLIVSCKYINAMDHVDQPAQSITTLSQKCFDYVLMHILNSSPDELLVLADEKNAIPQDIAYSLSKTIMAIKNHATFFPKIDGFPRITQKNTTLLIETSDLVEYSETVSPDKKLILKILRYDAQICRLDGRVIVKFYHSEGNLSDVFSPDSQFILITENSKSKQLWNLHGQSLAFFQHDSDIKSAKFSPDGRFVLITTADNTAHLWEIHPLWNSAKYRNRELTLQELAAVLLILKHKEFIQAHPEIKSLIYNTLDQIDGDASVPDEQRFIKNFFMKYLNS